ncbi:probable ATP-dependent RNA helicase DDX31 [Octopus bimaculoides]|uniref:ATP-dependent RNA helicase n=1 Tax=Octopus bimaculoides TaxID=37653 RepID=A0A0L8GI60_OCTBM|nr:probable ATP-dependent RNA helicase DDX31 [Octopus bimaculoides]|eukprot:XP_014780846.1 PREDICTED: probable ATP-dependent RNA helicase DDX31 [Octopus bimaculoides]
MADDDLVLNVYVSKKDSKSVKTNNSNNQSAPGRLKNKQLNGNQISSTFEYDEHIDSNEPYVSNSVKSRKRKVEKQPTTHSEKKSKTSAIHFSSLFNSNPEIPTVNPEPVQSVKEELFSKESFESLSLSPYILQCLRNDFQFSQMTTVQQLTIPPVLDGKDVLVKSHTGTGKTLSYAIPIVQTLQAKQPKLKRSDGVHAIVIVPTRELALQSFQTFQKLVNTCCWIVPTCIIGGEKRKSEKARLRKGVTILVGTPGRLTDHLLHTECLVTNRVQYLVIDEADRLHDMGFEKEVQLIISILNKSTPERQTILLSATLTEGVEKLAGISLKSPERIDASKEHKENNSLLTKGDSLFSVPEKLNQHFMIVPCKLRLVSLIGFIASKCINSNQKSKIMVFLSTQDSVEFHFKLFSEIFELERKDSKTFSDYIEKKSKKKKNSSLVKFYKLHGNMSQDDRTNNFTKYSLSRCGVLLCTDVAARGLDLAHVRWIVQYTSPGETREYIHRIGRTARAGAQGNSLLFLMPSETAYIKALNAMKINLVEIYIKNILGDLLQLLNLLPKIIENRRPVRTYEEAASSFQMYIENFTHNSNEMLDLAKKAFQSFVRSYSTYPKDLKDIFHLKYLHIGHLAKSFGLRDAPSQLGNNPMNKHFKFSKHDPKKSNFKYNSKLRFNKETTHKKKSVDMSEFASGLDW